MLEGLAAWILNTYVGEYLENLNTDQLSIGLLQGEVELENLPLRKDALKGLELPVKVHAGFVGKIKLQIPVSRLRSEPWVIFIERLFLIAGPILSSEYDEEAENASALTRKLAQLEMLDAKSKGMHDSKQNYSYYTNWMSYGTSLMANIIENVQLKIKDVHIRYEDDYSSSSQKFACGILINSLSAQSTDQHWIPKFVRRENNDFMWKLLELQGMSFYWDTDTDILSTLDSQSMMAAMAKYLEVSSVKKHNYILSPVNAEAHLTRNCSLKPLRSRFTPRIICDIHLQKIPLSLNDLQYRQMMECIKELEVLDIRWKHRKWRPTVPVKGNAQKWWLYAISVHLQPISDQNKAHTWKFASERAQDIAQYSKVYQEYLNKSDLPAESKVLKENLEKKLRFELIMLLRELVTKKMERNNSVEINDDQSKGKGFLQWMFPSWSGWYSDSSSNCTSSMAEEMKSETMFTSEEDQLKSHIEEEILDVLDSADNDSLLKRDTVFAQLNFSLSQGSFTLLQFELPSIFQRDKQKSKSTKPIMELEFSDVSTKLETRPRTGSFLFEIKLGAVYLHDRLDTDSPFPHVIAPQNRDVNFMYTKNSNVTIFPLPSFLNLKSEDVDSSNSYLFELCYEKKPFVIHADHKLIITTRALDIVYNPQVLKCITDFFCLQHGKTSKDFSLSELKLTAAARARYETLKQQTKAELQHKWDQILEGEDKTVSDLIYSSS